jgi:hypothetical protein
MALYSPAADSVVKIPPPQMKLKLRARSPLNMTLLSPPMHENSLVSSDAINYNFFQGKNPIVLVWIHSRLSMMKATQIFTE